MKQKSGLADTTKSFFGKSRGLKTCPKCKKNYMEGALDFLSDEKTDCPICDNGKDEE